MNERSRKTMSDDEHAAEIKRVQEEVRKHVPEGVSLVDELIEERCWEAAKEEQESEGYGSIEHWLEIIKKRRGIKG